MYHLSRNPDLSTIRDVRGPGMAHGESQTPRLSVAPTVAQCILALSQEGNWFIYKVHVKNPVRADRSVLDRELTDEHWITQEVLDQEGGSIEVSKLGHVNLEREMLTDLKIAFHHYRLRCTPQEEQQAIWEVQGELWKPRFCGPSEIDQNLDKLQRG